MNYNMDFVQTSIGQIGVLCVTAGLVEGSFVYEAWLPALSLMIVGIVLVLVGSIRRKVK